MDRRQFLAAGGASAAGAFLGCLAAQERAMPQPARPPNVILVLTDDQGYGDLACHGNPHIQTPNLDWLHAHSTRLTDFHVDPTCSPTRSALLTGRYSSRTGVWHTIMGRSLLRRDELTLADVFAANGYRTGIFGKWHLGDNLPFRPQDRGFHHTLVHGGGGVGQTPDYWGNDYFDDTYWLNDEPRPFEGYCTDVWFRGALEFIEANRDRPFFAYIPTNAPHGPYRVADEYWKPYAEKGVPEGRARFYGMITNIDENMGRLVARLRELGLERDTILLFITDNGTSAGPAAGMRGRKGSEYDGGHRVPCFIRWPGRVEEGRDIDLLTAHIDILPTLVELCGLQKPDGPQLDGASLAALLTGEARRPQRTLLVHSQRIEHPRKWRKCAVMTDRWRLVNGKELYDIQADPGQKKNLAAENPDVVQKLRAAYDAWWDDLSGRFDEFCRIVIGSERENPSRITAHDWHGRRVPWNQGMVRNTDLYANGFWAVEVARPGTYRFTLRQMDTPARFPIQATTARLKIGEVDETRPVPEGATGVDFEVRLQPGQARLQTWLADEASGRSRGAYYVYVERLG
ncbi:MAG: arylsulfatase [Candidatus Brocadiia bacterium]